MKHEHRFGPLAVLPFAIALCLAFSSCWMPAFDPAVSLSVEMDEFFEEHGESAWRREYDIEAGEDDEWLSNLEFLPARDGSPGGFLVLRQPSYFKVAQLANDGSRWTIGWQYGDSLTLGSRALIESHMLGPTSGLLVFAKLEQGPFYIMPNSSPEPLSMTPSYSTNFVTTDKLIAFGTLGSISANDPVLHLLSYNPGTGFTMSYSGEVASDTVALVPTPSGSFAPGVIKVGFAVAEGGPVQAEFDRDGPELWLWNPASNPAKKMAEIEDPVSGAFHSSSMNLGIGLLSEGTLYTEIYESSGAHHGSLPTGIWRFAFEWYDSGNGRWLMVYARVLGIREGDKSIRLKIRVEAVPTEALLDFAKD